MNKLNLEFYYHLNTHTSNHLQIYCYSICIFWMKVLCSAVYVNDMKPFMQFSMRLSLTCWVCALNFTMLEELLIVR